MIKCQCGEPWRVQPNLAAYEGEVVLVCLKCGERYFNAQEWFNDEDFIGLEHISHQGIAALLERIEK